MKYLLLVALALLQLGSSAYTPQVALELAYMSAVTYNPIAQISAWTCSECKRYPLTNVKAFFNTTNDILGFVGYSTASNAIIAAFRGTVGDDIANWLVDARFAQVAYPRCSNCAVHQGFYHSYLEVSATAKAQVQLILSKYRNASIWVTGHSLGGAIATMAALDFKDTFGRVDQFYSFGEPRPGNSNFSLHVKLSLQNYYRVIHYADIVPHYPPQGFLDYYQAGTQIWYTENMQSYKECLTEDPSCANSIAPVNLSIPDHQIPQYLKLAAVTMQTAGLRSNDY